MSAERRKWPRRTVNQPVLMMGDGGTMIAPCTMVDVSAGGARLKLDAEIPVPNEFNLMLSKFNAGVMRRCLIAWRDERQLGVRFVNA
jgi:hypothetical protein